MTKRKLKAKRGSTFLEQTGSFGLSSDVLALGQQFVDELNLEPSVDTLGRWMAHYIAGLMAKAQSATGEEKRATEKQCFDAILRLWEHRAELPNGARPFEDMEPILRTIRSLDVDDDTPRHFRSARPPLRGAKENDETKTWLAMVEGLDYSSKVLIGYCLAAAARTTSRKSSKWVALADAASVENGPVGILVRFISQQEYCLGKKPDPTIQIAQQLADRASRLETFAKLAVDVVGKMRAQIVSLALSGNSKPPLKRGRRSSVTTKPGSSRKRRASKK